MDEEFEVESVPRIPRVRNYIHRDCESAATRLWNDYFAEPPIFPAKKFKRRFCIRINLFLRITQGISSFANNFTNPVPEHFDFFIDRQDAAGRQSFTILQKCTSAIRQMAYGTAPDIRYMRSPTAIDVARLCTRGDAWVQGMTGFNNDINVLNQSPLFDALKMGTAPDAPFEVNGNQYTKRYYLADGIYPDWATLIKGMSCPTDEPKIKFTRFHASARKDIERAFGVLQGKFHILSLPARAMQVNKMRKVMECCHILHNMILEDNNFALCKWEERFIIEQRENRAQ
ncbi:uncharacterized protein [Rutidosis leptorrhynchoides]|uniref:uncharacterized protein n=1 Tax=Rutidosis leptorrhynchoides TaxID=125765 RepID=UPI003A99BF0D